ncbi:hypothetical protein NHQ30_008468 [Ciborinia camelliae]|nr:hypothetical protein NHQ30_008468 [Ciborinia camelliae]
MDSHNQGQAESPSASPTSPQSSQISDHYDSSGQCRPLCECFARIPLLAAGTPTSGEVNIEQVVNNGQSIVTSWRKLIQCQKCTIDVRRMRILHSAVQKQVALYDAAARRYSDDRTGFPDFSHSSLTCRKTTAYLGSVALEEDEINLLACQVLSRSIVNFFHFLRDMYSMLQQSPSVSTHADEMVQMQLKIHSYVQLIYKHIGRMRSV